MKRYGFNIIVCAITLLVMGAYFSTVVFADEFDSTTLGKVWTVDNPNSANTWSLTEKPGWFRFSVLAGQDTWSTTRGLMPLLLQPAPKGDYSMETHLKVDAQLDSTYGCLVVWKGPGEWIHLELILNGACNGAMVQYWPAVAGTNTGKCAVAAPDDMYLKTERKGDNWNFYYKLNEKDNWILFDSVTLKYDDPHQVGIGAKTWGVNPIVADFDYFRCPELNEVQTVQPDSKLAFTWAGIKVGF